MSAADASGALALVLLHAERAEPGDLRAALVRCGLQVVAEDTVTQFASGLRWNQAQADAVLLDLDGATDAELDLLDGLLERLALPMIFQDGRARTDDPVWLQRLAGKIRAEAAVPAAVSMAAASARLVPEPLRCWALGASFGGPEALKRFLTAISEPPPQTAFVIGQHIGDGFVDVLASQLNRATAFQVASATDGAVLESGRIFVAPVRERLRIDPSGVIRLEPEVTERGFYTPSIDRLMEEVAVRFGERSGAIVFSGMGDDGARGSVAIARAGGIVWAQAAASCTIDSMPNCARATGTVSRSGTPEELAVALARHLRATAAAAHVRTASAES